MKTFVFDTETTGLPRFDLPADDPTQARIIQLAGLLIGDRQEGDEGEAFDDNPALVVLGSMNTLIKPDGWVMDDALAAKMGHGYDHARLEADGVPIAVALDAWARLHDAADLIVGFSLAFDQKLMRGDLRRAGMDDRYGAKPHIDVMYACKPACKVRGLTKQPKLIEACKTLMDYEYPPHDAYRDAHATARVFYWLRANGYPLEQKQHTPNRVAA